MGKKGKGTKQQDSIENSYVILEKNLGEGGNAIVSLAKEKSSGKEVAIKALSTRNGEKEIRFADEVKVMTENADIPGILPIFDSNLTHFWYAMPVAIEVFKHSGNLLDASPNRAYFSGIDRSVWIKDIIDGFIQLAETLEQLHARGIHHRDIKPENIYEYDGRYTLGDFGLVEFPDNDNNQTRNDKGIGAIFTIAPEMKRNPKDADGAPADVYSLTKTLWIMLTRDEKGFDGQYSWNDRSHGLRYYDHLNDEYLVELEELLHDGTSNVPADRPSISQFKERLRQWLDIHSMKSDVEREKREWKFIASRIFDNNRIPKRTEYNDSRTIVDILNALAQSHASNHMMIPGGGGLDFTYAELAPEPEFIYVYADGFAHLLRPKALYYESFDDSRWDYWMIECEETAPISGIYVDEDGIQELVEDTPAHYVQGQDSVYGVYDYDSGTPLPNGWKRVTRYTKGNFLIVMKTCTYNQISATYDGRHSDMTNDEFRKYIDTLQKTLTLCSRKGVYEGYLLGTTLFEQHPYPERNRRYSSLLKKKIELLPSPTEYIRENHQNWNFSDLIPSGKGEGKLAYRFIFEPEKSGSSPDFDRIFIGESDSDKLYLTVDGSISKEGRDCCPPLEVYDRKIAISMLKNFNNRLKELCEGFNAEDIDSSSYFDIEWRRIAPPSHLFSEKEIIAEMKNADDRFNNQLVIDEDGFARVIRIDGNDYGDLYPVSLSIWGGRKKYVGKYSDCSNAHDNYKESLGRWLMHLKTGQQVSFYCQDNKDSQTIIAEINSLTNTGN